MKKLLCLLMLVFTFCLVGCGKKQQKNSNISEEDFIGILRFEVAYSMRGYYDEDSFKTDPNNSEAEIGYYFSVNKDVEGDNDFTISIERYGIRRNKETKETMDSDDLNKDNSGNIYLITYSSTDISPEYKKGFYKLTFSEYNNYDTMTVKKIDKDEFIELSKLDFYIVPTKDITFNGQSYDAKVDGKEYKGIYPRIAANYQDKNVAIKCPDDDYIYLFITSDTMKKIRGLD